MTEPREKTILPIVTIPDLRLKEKARPVQRIQKRHRDLLDAMAATMEEAEGVGLAAPQVGLLERIFIAQVEGQVREFINPEILEKSEETEEGWEGCLSVPYIHARVPRALKVRITALDRKGHRFWLDLEGIDARVVQHELDHLDGLLILDRGQKFYEVPKAARHLVVFLGTPEFSVRVLLGLYDKGLVPKLIVTAPDRQRGRGQKLAPSPVKEVAQELEIPVVTPEKLRDPQFQEAVQKMRPDILLTVAYGRKLPSSLLSLPKKDALNLHASLLPRWRGAAPIARAIWAGDKVTGITVMRMREKIDEGEILKQVEIPIDKEDDAGTLAEKMALAGVEALWEVLTALWEGPLSGEPQDESRATWAPPIGPEETWVRWDAPAEEVVRQVRALTPEPGVRTWRVDPPGEAAGEGEGQKELWRLEKVEAAAAEGEPGMLLAA
ncbi:MAG: methionyl-tRNA formyltransferase, partial [Bacillota bacterium]|nr:methionyl-tRNA formyltransferase [Bacillota bacterium]